MVFSNLAKCLQSVLGMVIREYGCKYPKCIASRSKAKNSNCYIDNIGNNAILVSGDNRENIQLSGSKYICQYDADTGGV